MSITIKPSQKWCHYMLILRIKVTFGPLHQNWS